MTPAIGTGAAAGSARSAEAPGAFGTPSPKRCLPAATSSPCCFLACFHQALCCASEAPAASGRPSHDATHSHWSVRLRDLSAAPRSGRWPWRRARMASKSWASVRTFMPARRGGGPSNLRDFRSGEGLGHNADGRPLVMTQTPEYEYDSPHAGCLQEQDAARATLPAPRPAPTRPPPLHPPIHPTSIYLDPALTSSVPAHAHAFHDTHARTHMPLPKPCPTPIP